MVFWIFKLLLLLCVLHSPIFSQIVFEPLHRDVYNFLSRLSQKGIIEYNDLITPLSRKYIAQKLNELSLKTTVLTPLEKKELAFYKKDFRFELDFINDVNFVNEAKHSYFGKDIANRYRLFSYRDNFFSINLSPILGYETGDNDGIRNTHRWNGVSLYGYLGKHFGYSFDFRDNREQGQNIDTSKAFTPVTGIDAQFFPENNAIEYSEVHTTMTGNWKWGSITVGKDFINWGYGKNGKVVLSSKAPSFAYIRLDAQLASWLKFNYFHAWLQSDVIDSTRIFPTLIEGQNSIQFRPKFLASHTIIITPKKGLDISLGESVIYDNQLEFVYLIPIMFYRLADHYLSSRRNDAGSNAQLFFAINSRNHIRKTNFYGEIFIDDLSIPNIFNPDRQVNHFGYTLGASTTDFPLNNLTLSSEYTRINPFVYRHFIPTQLYTSSSYLMGHWMGHNSDQWYGELNYRFLRGLQATAWARHIRKGEDGEVADQYTFPHNPFLFGLNTKFTDWGITVKYEITHELFLRGKFQRLRVSEAQANGGFIETSRNELFLSLFYGL